MPHDRNGRKLEPGQRVRIDAVVDEVLEGEEACNASVTFIGGPEDEYHPQVTCNSRLFEIVDD